MTALLFKRLLLKFGITVLIITSFFCLWSVAASRAAEPEDLRSAIESKSKALQEVNQQIQETQRNLDVIEEKGKTLSQEIKRSDITLQQLNLSIKSSQIKTEKLGLEVESLELDIDGKKEAISSKKGAIVDFLRQIQEKDRETMLVVFLTSRSLAESVFESQSLNGLSEGLAREVNTLTTLKEDLEGKLSEASRKKTELENENQTLRNRRGIVQDQRQERQEILRTTKNQEKIFQEQLKALEKQQAEIASEVEAIERELRGRIDPNLLPIPRAGVLAWPSAAKVMSQGYGLTSFASRNYKGKWHNGIDIAGPIGTEIYAAEQGSVVLTGDQDRFCPRGAYGKFIVIKHENGLTTLYGHLSRIGVTSGQAVERGQLIGYMGRTGWATGSHLHFVVWSSTTYAVRATRSCGQMPVGGDINPLDYLGRQFSIAPIRPQVLTSLVLSFTV